MRQPLRPINVKQFSVKCESKFAGTTAYNLGHIFRTPEIQLVNKKAHFQPRNGNRKICHAKLMLRKFIAHVIREVYPPLAGEIGGMTQGWKE